MVISYSSSEGSLYQDESSTSKRSSSRRTRNARRSFDDYVCDGDSNNSSADVTDDDDDFRPSSKTSARRTKRPTISSSKKNTKKKMTSSSTITITSPRVQANGVTETFPVKLHKMLEGNAANGLEHIASWQPHGRCFVVHNQQEFVDLVMPDYFSQSKYPSFQRQLNLYGFKRITKGPDRNGYHHPSFLRGYPELSDTMVRMKVKGTGVRRPTCPDEEPDFYKYPDLPAAGHNVKSTSKASASTKAKTSKKPTKQQPKLRRSGPCLSLIKASGTGRGKVLSCEHTNEAMDKKQKDQHTYHCSPNRIVTPPISPEGYGRPKVDIMDVLDNALLVGSTDNEDTVTSNRSQQIHLPIPEPPLTGAASAQLQNDQQMGGADHTKMEFEAWPTSAMSSTATNTDSEADSDVCYFFGRPFHYLEAMRA